MSPTSRRTPKPRNEEAPHKQIEPQARTSSWVPPSNADARWTAHAEPSSTEGPLAAHPGLAGRVPGVKESLYAASLKGNEAFRAVYRRGRWVHGQALSVGLLPSGRDLVRIGFRTRRGLKGAVQRNRLKRQLRALVYANQARLRSGFDLVIVAHPPTLPAPTASLQHALLSLCKKAGALR